MGRASVRIFCLGRPDRRDLASAVLSEASAMGAEGYHAVPEGEGGLDSMDRASVDWRGSLESANWLLNSSSTVLEGDGPRWAWGASMSFAEIEGANSAMLVEMPEDPERMGEAWGAVIERIRQIHLLFLEPGALGSIAAMEGCSEGDLLGLVRERGLVPLVCSYDPTSRTARVEHPFGSTEVVTDCAMDVGTWLAAFMCELPLSGRGADGIGVAAKACSSKFQHK